MLTAVAGLITAITGLIVAVRQVWPHHAAAGSPAAVVTSAPETVSVSTPSSGLRIAFPAGTHAEVGDLAYDIVGSSARAGNPGETNVVLRVRMTNKGQYPANFWSRTFRLRAGADTSAPTNLLDDVVDGGTTDVGAVDFSVSGGARTATLLVGDNAAKAVSLPLLLGRGN